MNQERVHGRCHRGRADGRTDWNPFHHGRPLVHNLEKAPFNPPSWVFGPVWTPLYVMIGYAGWRAWLAEPSLSRTLALRGWWTQLALNASWTPIFFGLQPGGGAGGGGGRRNLVAPAKGCRDGRDAVVPYLGWVLFATALNAWIVFAN